MCLDKREKRKWKSRKVWAPFEFSLYPRTTAAQTKDWNMVLNERFPFVLAQFFQLLDMIDYRNPYYSFLMICLFQN